MTVSETLATELENDAVETRRTEVVAEERKLVVEEKQKSVVDTGDPQKVTGFVDTKARKAVRWYEGYRAGYFC